MSAGALADLFASGRIVDAILVLVAAEAALVALRPGLLGRRAPVLAGLGAGAGLLLALRTALAGAPWPWIAAALAAAFAAHLTEMGLRRAEAVRRREPPATSLSGPALAAKARRSTKRIGASYRPPFEADRGGLRLGMDRAVGAPDPGEARVPPAAPGRGNAAPAT